jgi:hypothetical protein
MGLAKKALALAAAKKGLDMFRRRQRRTAGTGGRPFGAPARRTRPVR